MKMLKARYFGMEWLNAYACVGMYELMLFEIVNTENYLISLDVIINSEGRFLYTHCLSVLDNTSLYKMLLLRAAHMHTELKNLGMKDFC